jgi:3-hydroxyisobutyrate dehydrogenase
MSEAAALKPPATIGFIGLGAMGVPMSSFLIKAGYKVQGFDLAPTARDRFTQMTGVAAVNSVAEACAGASAIITILPEGKVVRRALLEPVSGNTAPIQSAPRGALVIEMSSSSPVDTRKLEGDLRDFGIDVIDAPVSGGVRRAVDASLAIMIGGAPANVDRAMPILQAMGKQLFKAGPVGAGHTMKAINNYVSAAGFAASVEALLMGKEYGIEPELLVDILNASTGRNNATEVKLKQQILSGKYATGFSMKFMAKDLGIAVSMAEHAGFDAPFAHACDDLWAKAASRVDDRVDHSEIYKYLDSLRSGK